MKCLKILLMLVMLIALVTTQEEDEDAETFKSTYGVSVMQEQDASDPHKQNKESKQDLRDFDSRHLGLRPSTSVKGLYSNNEINTRHHHLTAVPLHESQEPTSLRGSSRLDLVQTSGATMTCPKLCLAKGSPGPDCCKKRRVLVTTNRLSRKKCMFSEIYCEGECVKPHDNEKHCGKCNNNCNEGVSCVFGMCGDYA